MVSSIICTMVRSEVSLDSTSSTSFAFIWGNPIKKREEKKKTRMRTNISVLSAVVYTAFSHSGADNSTPTTDGMRQAPLPRSRGVSRLVNSALSASSAQCSSLNRYYRMRATRTPRGVSTRGYRVHTTDDRAKKNVTSSPPPSPHPPLSSLLLLPRVPSASPPRARAKHQYHLPLLQLERNACSMVKMT